MDNSGPSRQVLNVGGQKRAIWKPYHQKESAGVNLPKPHYLPPTAGNTVGAWKTSGTFLDYELPRDIGSVNGLNLRFEVNCSVVGGQLSPGTPHWVQQIEVYIGSQIVETLYPQDIWNETVGFLTKDDLDATNEVLLVNPTQYGTTDQRIPNTGTYGGNFFAYLPFNCCITASRLYIAGIADPVKFRVYFPPNLFPTITNPDTTVGTTTLAAATLIIEEDFVHGVAKDDNERAHREGITYNTVVRQRQNLSVNRTTGSGNTIDLTGINGASAGLIIYAGPVVSPGGNTNNALLTTRYPIATLELNDSMGSKKEGLEQMRGEYLIAFTWRDQINTPYPAQDGNQTYLLPFCQAFRDAVENASYTGSLKISTKGNDRLVLSNHVGANATWSFTITNYVHQAFVFQNNKLVSIVKEWDGKKW